MSSALALVLALVIGAIIFFVSWTWLGGIIEFGILGLILAAIIALILGYIAYRLILRIYGEARSAR